LISKEIPQKPTKPSNKENTSKSKGGGDLVKKQQDSHKFENYFKFSCPIKFVKSHQILAINRGENLKILSVKVETPDYLKFDLKKFIENLYMQQGSYYKTRTDLIQVSFEEAYTKKLQPLLVRQIRSELTKCAEKESIEIFASNLKQLLLQSTTKGEPILGIDPGFSNGCKLALISECSEVLETGVIYPHNSDRWLDYGEKLGKMMRKHQ
jgi:transcriptional accessory protein Tex/SPT6